MFYDSRITKTTDDDIPPRAFLNQTMCSRGLKSNNVQGISKSEYVGIYALVPEIA